MSISNLPWRDIVTCYVHFDNGACLDLLTCGHIARGYRHEGFPGVGAKPMTMPDRRRRCSKCFMQVGFTAQEREAQEKYNLVPEPEPVE